MLGSAGLGDKLGTQGQLKPPLWQGKAAPERGICESLVRMLREEGRGWWAGARGPTCQQSQRMCPEAGQGLAEARGLRCPCSSSSLPSDINKGEMVTSSVTPDIHAVGQGCSPAAPPASMRQTPAWAQALGGGSADGRPESTGSGARPSLHFVT